jgi:hypothetical protein
MDFSLNSLATRYPRPRTTGRTAAAPTAHGASARTTLVLALGAYGLIDVVEDLGAPWAWLVQTLVLALLALGFFVAARRSHDHRVGWLLSSSVATGLAIAAFYSLVDTAAIPALPVAGLLVGIAIVLFVVHGVSRGRARRARPPAASSIYGASRPRSSSGGEAQLVGVQRRRWRATSAPVRLYNNDAAVDQPPDECGARLPAV